MGLKQFSIMKHIKVQAKKFEKICNLDLVSFSEYMN